MGDLSPKHMISSWCYRCNFGEHAHCTTRADRGRYSQAGPEGSCACENAAHIEPPGIAGTCRIRVHRGDSRMSDTGPSGRPAKGKLTEHWMSAEEPVEVPACGLHLAGRKRSEQKDAEHRSADQRSAENERSAAATAERLTAAGIPATVFYDTLRSRYTGAVTVQGEALAAMLDELDRLRMMTEDLWTP